VPWNGRRRDHEVGHKAAEESKDEIKEALKAPIWYSLPLVWRRHRTGSAAVVAEIAKQSGALTIAIVTKPFTFEGKHRLANAQAALTTWLVKPIR